MLSRAMHVSAASLLEKLKNFASATKSAIDSFFLTELVARRIPASRRVIQRVLGRLDCPRPAQSAKASSRRPGAWTVQSGRARREVVRVCVCGRRVGTSSERRSADVDWTNDELDSESSSRVSLFLVIPLHHSNHLYLTTRRRLPPCSLDPPSALCSGQPTRRLSGPFQHPHLSRLLCESWRPVCDRSGTLRRSQSP